MKNKKIFLISILVIVSLSISGCMYSSIKNARKLGNTLQKQKSAIQLESVTANISDSYKIINTYKDEHNAATTVLYDDTKDQEGFFIIGVDLKTDNRKGLAKYFVKDYVENNKEELLNSFPLEDVVDDNFVELKEEIGDNKEIEMKKYGDINFIIITSYSEKYRIFMSTASSLDTKYSPVITLYKHGDKEESYKELEKVLESFNYNGVSIDKVEGIDDSELLYELFERVTGELD